MAAFLTDEHRMFQDVFRLWVQREVTPNLRTWEAERLVPRTVWESAGKQGFLCPWAPEEYGGAEADFGYSYIINHELSRAGSSLMFGLHSDVVVPYLSTYGTSEQKARWLPGCVKGELITAVAMTEPGTGSDLQGIRTTAVRDGDSYILNGQKVFISNGMHCDLVVVVCRTDAGASGRNGLSLIVVEAGTPGFIKARKLDKMGLHSQDTAELFFEECRVPAANLLGQENMGFRYLMEKLQPERLCMAIQAQATAERILELTQQYVTERQAFGQAIGSLQHIQFKVAEMATEVALGRSFVDDLTQEFMAGRDIVTRVSMAKWWVTEMANRIAYDAVQLHGGYGYMEEYEVCRLYRDVRMQTIAAGTTEIMKQTIAKRLGL